MGGSIGVTIREEDGTEHRMCRWTNSLPGFIHDIRFINKDKTYLKEYLKMWEDMREDWLENKNNKDLKFKSEPLEVLGKFNIGDGQPQKFRYNMTDAYAPYPYLAPMDYGLVVIDIQKNVILHLQGYCKIGSFHVSNVDSGFKDEVDALKDLNNAKRIKVIKDINGNMIKDVKIIPNKSIYVQVDIDMSPFKIIKFDESKKGVKELKKEVLKLDFKLTKEEEKIWKEYIKRYDG